MTTLARKVIETCREIAAFTEWPGRTTRTFLSPPMRDVHRLLGDWMRSLGMEVWIDPAGNLRAVVGPGLPACRRASTRRDVPRLVIGSHLDTVPNAGAFDGILGVVLGIALVEASAANREVPIEVIGFSDEEGVRFGVPFIGSRAVAGTLDNATLYGLDPDLIPQARLDSRTAAYLEFHIEQGPVLDNLRLPLAVVEGIMGQSRLQLAFQGQANHAGTTPQSMRRDALAAAAAWISRVESFALADCDLRATVGSIRVEPNATNVIAGLVRASLDVRHASDESRHFAVRALVEEARQIGSRRGIGVAVETTLDQPATPMDRDLIRHLTEAVEASGYPVHTMISGAGHDAMILAPVIPSAMLFLRSPGGVSHHPDETVLPEDVGAALEVGLRFIRDV